MSSRDTATGRSASATSASLIARATEQDAEAWARLVSLYTPLIVHWCALRRLPLDDVPDIVQEVFRAVVRNLHGFRKQYARGTFRGWLRRITENKIHDHHRRLRVEPRGTGGTENGFRLQRLATIPPADATEVGVNADQCAHSQLLHRALAAIREHFRESTWQAFWGTAVEGRPPKDVGPELSMSPGAVRVAKSRVLQRLREELGDQV